MATLCSDFAFSDTEKHSPVQTGVALQVFRPKESLSTQSTAYTFREIPSGGGRWVFFLISAVRVFEDSMAVYKYRMQFVLNLGLAFVEFQWNGTWELFIFRVGSDLIPPSPCSGTVCSGRYHNTYNVN